MRLPASTHYGMVRLNVSDAKSVASKAAEGHVLLPLLIRTLSATDSFNHTSYGVFMNRWAKPSGSSKHAQWMSIAGLGSTHLKNSIDTGKLGNQLLFINITM